MESSLHRQLKELYAGEGARVEEQIGGFRIDAVRDGVLIEIQHGSLAAIRDKVRRLLNDHRVLVVKPLVASKLLIKQDARQGCIVSRRMSPKRGSFIDLFQDLVHFVHVFPNRNLAIEVPLIDIEEWRYPGRGRQRRRRRAPFQIEDQKLVRIHGSQRFSSAWDLLRLLPAELPRPFHTGHLSRALSVPRWLSQRIAYCLRHAGVAREVGRERNTRLYKLRRPRGIALPCDDHLARRAL